MNDKFRDECGVFGVWGDPDAAALTLTALTALQHRGQDSAGIAISRAGGLVRRRRPGVVANLASDVADLRPATTAIGHVRYATVGDGDLRNAQPLLLACGAREIALCHNGQLVNFADVRRELEAGGTRWMTTSDSEIILQLCRVSRQPTAADAVIEALGRVEGAFSLLLLVEDLLIAARDPHGFRPLCLGRRGLAHVVASESCALDAVGARYVREIEPGEIVTIGAAGVTTVAQRGAARRMACVFEHVYFARADSRVFGENVGAVRHRLGQVLAREAPAEADMVVPIPDSGLWAALGYHDATAIPLRFGLARNTYVGRTFIEPTLRQRGVSRRVKLNPIRALLDGKRIVLVDDSIVRGETMARTVADVRAAGAREVHVRIASPPTIASCFYGINTPTRGELVAADRSVDEVRRLIGADTLGYVTLEGLLDAIGRKTGHYCTACYTGDHHLLRAPRGREPSEPLLCIAR